jgi:NAD(P)-dependent dehydrogenase (short-subunit alcohol dehydrogenase family)
LKVTDRLALHAAAGSPVRPDASSSLPDAVIVTGAGRGIGRSVAVAIAKRQIPTLCVARTSTCEETSHTINSAGGIAEAMPLDLADQATSERALSQWIDSRPYQRLGVVLAAAVLGPPGPLENSDLNEWANVIAVNVLGNLAVVRALLGRMRNAAYGRILFFGGGGAAYAYPLFPAYACSKAAVVRAAENLHEDVKDQGDFAVACLAPGAVDTDMLHDVRAAGGEVRTTAPIEEAIGFVDTFLTHRDAASLSGRFVHVRDGWKEVVDGTRKLGSQEWKLRRVE